MITTEAQDRLDKIAATVYGDENLEQGILTLLRGNYSATNDMLVFSAGTVLQTPVLASYINTYQTVPITFTAEGFIE